MKTEIIKNLFLNVVLIVFSLIFYYNDKNIITAVLLLLLALRMFFYYKEVCGYYTNVRGIFSFIWLGTIALATLKIHPMQSTWKPETWACLICTYVFFIIGSSIKLKMKDTPKTKASNYVTKKQMTLFTNIILYLPIIALLIEIVKNGGMVPAMSDEMSAYANFATGKIHYITVACCFGLPCTIIYFNNFKTSKLEKLYLILLNLVNILIPILIVSRQLLICIIVLSLYAFIMYRPNLEKKILIIGLIMTLCGWLVISSFRNQNAEYLKRNLMMEPDTKLVTNMQIYMYVTFNYDNFDYNVGELSKKGYGINSVFPIFGLTGIKRFLPQAWFESTGVLAKKIPVYNTYPFSATPYMDGGLLAVCIYSFVIGLLCRASETIKKDKVFGIAFNLIIKCCLTFTFFCSWFSRPVWWFYVIYILVLSFVFLKNRTLKKGCEVS